MVLPVSTLFFTMATVFVPISSLAVVSTTVVRPVVVPDFNWKAHFLQRHLIDELKRTPANVDVYLIDVYDVQDGYYGYGLSGATVFTRATDGVTAFDPAYEQSLRLSRSAKIIRTNGAGILTQDPGKPMSEQLELLIRAGAAHLIRPAHKQMHD